jgi:hypothetical protein
MATKQQEFSEPEKQGRQDLSAMIGKGVLHLLGQPKDLVCVQVRHLWDGRYRVNVMVGPGNVCAKVANSYFLVTDNDGNIVSAIPKITRRYFPTAEAASRPEPSAIPPC